MYNFQDYEPIDNILIEGLLKAIYTQNNKVLTRFAEKHLIPKKPELYGLSYDATLHLITESLKFLLEKNREDRRKIGNHFNSKHSIDVPQLLLLYDLGENVDFTTVIAGLNHDLPEEDTETEYGMIQKASIRQIRAFLERTIDSMNLDSEHINIYKQSIDEISDIINPLIDPFYKNLQMISGSARRIPSYIYNDDPDIGKLIDLAINEKKNFDFYVNLKLIIKRIIKNNKENKHSSIKRIIEISEETTKNYMQFLFNTFFSTLLEKKEIANKVIYLKFTDKISQNYETVEEEPKPSDGEKWKNFIKKHNLVQKHGQDLIDKLKKKKKDDDILIENITLREYKSLEDLKISGSDILSHVFKTFLTLDFGARYINYVYVDSDEECDATLLNLWNVLAYTTLKHVIEPRLEHLIKWGHIKKNVAKKISKDIDTYNSLYKLTRGTSENDIIYKYYFPAMKGNIEMINTLNFNKKRQYRHLEIWRHVFNRYIQDTPNFGKLERELFTFDWREYLNKFFNDKNGSYRKKKLMSTDAFN